MSPVPRLLHCCYTVVRLLLDCCYTVVTLLAHYCHNVVTGASVPSRYLLCLVERETEVKGKGKGKSEGTVVKLHPLEFESCALSCVSTKRKSSTHLNI
jgi:hypothetical protein